jgi:hypothetical protein
MGGRSDYGRGTYITCLDCGQKFAYNHKTRRLVDFWGIHDPEARAGVRRKIAEFFPSLRIFAVRAGRNNLKNPMSEPARSMRPLGL